MNITNHWREIFDPAAQIFLNSVVISKKFEMLSAKQRLSLCGVEP
jgi:hypothetical protein